MVDLAIWGFADVLTVEQAACLWVGSDPAANPYRRSPDEFTRIAAIKQALSGAIAANLLAADSSRNALATIGDYSKSLVTKGANIAYLQWPRPKPETPGGLEIWPFWLRVEFESSLFADENTIPHNELCVTE